MAQLARGQPSNTISVRRSGGCGGGGGCACGGACPSEGCGAGCASPAWGAASQRHAPQVPTWEGPTASTPGATDAPQAAEIRDSTCALTFTTSDTRAASSISCAYRATERSTSTTLGAVARMRATSERRCARSCSISVSSDDSRPSTRAYSTAPPRHSTRGSGPEVAMRRWETALRVATPATTRQEDGSPPGRRFTNTHARGSATALVRGGDSGEGRSRQAAAFWAREVSTGAHSACRGSPAAAHAHATSRSKWSLAAAASGAATAERTEVDVEAAAAALRGEEDAACASSAGGGGAHASATVSSHADVAAAAAASAAFEPSVSAPSPQDSTASPSPASTHASEPPCVASPCSSASSAPHAATRSGWVSSLERDDARGGGCDASAPASPPQNAASDAKEEEALSVPLNSGGGGGGGEPSGGGRSSSSASAGCGAAASGGASPPARASAQAPTAAPGGIGASSHSELPSEAAVGGALEFECGAPAVTPFPDVASASPSCKCAPKPGRLSCVRGRGEGGGVPRSTLARRGDPPPLLCRCGGRGGSPAPPLVVRASQCCWPGGSGAAASGPGRVGGSGDSGAPSPPTPSSRSAAAVADRAAEAPAVPLRSSSADADTQLLLFAPSEPASPRPAASADNTDDSGTGGSLGVPRTWKQKEQHRAASPPGTAGGSVCCVHRAQKIRPHTRHCARGKAC